MKVTTDYDPTKGEPVEVQVCAMKLADDEDGYTLCEPGDQVAFYDILVKGAPDAGGQIHVFLEYEELPDMAFVEYSLAVIEDCHPGLPVEYLP